MLKDTESLFTTNVEALDFDYIPKIVPFRESEQKQIANCIKPLFQKRNGRNLLIHGKPGIGKTVAVKHLLKEIEDETDEIFPIFINCWQTNTSFKIMLEICNQLGYKFTQNKKTEELTKVIKEIINKNSGAVLIFDEIDKVEDTDFLYLLLEEVYRKTIVLITNYKTWFTHVDERTRSRLIPDLLEFKEYNEQETIKILKERMKFAFVPDVWSDEAFNLLARKAAEMKDIRTGLFLIKEAGQLAEDQSKKKIEKEEAIQAIAKLESFSIKSSTDLVDIEKEILEMIKKNNEMKIGDLFKMYAAKGKDISYRTFQRRIKKLEEGKFISIQKLEGGAEGKTSIIKYGESKKLTEF